MKILKYYEIWKINLLNSLMYFSEFIVWSLFIAFIIFIYVNLWQSIYSTNELIEGFSIAMMVWYLVMTESIVTSSPQTEFIKELNYEVKSGDLSYILNKPYSYLLYHYTRKLSQGMVAFVLTFGLGGLIAFLLIGKITLSLISIPFILLTVLSAFTIDFTISGIIGISAFWLEDTNSFRYIYEKLVFILGGMLLPLEIFPEGLRTISSTLPFSYMAYHPAKLFVMFDLRYFFEVIFMQLFYVLIFSLLLLFLYKKAVRKVNIHGG